MRPGSKVREIPWRSDLMDMYVSVSNSSGFNYENFSFAVESIAMENPPKGVSLGFYEIAQLDGPKECHAQRIGEIRAGVKGIQQIRPPGRPIEGINLYTTVREVRVDCPRFSDGGQLVSLVALTNVRDKPGLKVKPSVVGIRFQYTINARSFTERTCVDVRDMDADSSKRDPKTHEQLCSQLVSGKAGDTTDRSSNGLSFRITSIPEPHP
jgi:hypothetical protein